MKKIILLSLTFSIQFFFAPVNAQVLRDTLQQKSIIIQSIDSINSTRLNLIEQNLTSFCKNNRTSQLLIILGTSVATSGALFYKPKNGDINYISVLGGVLTLSGTIIYIDSFRFLNFNKKNKKHKTNLHNSDYFFE